MIEVFIPTFCYDCGSDKLESADIPSCLAILNYSCFLISYCY
jgi:hypothetical protein